MNQTDTRPITLLIADDHPVTRDGLALMLSTEPQFVVVGQAEGQEAIELYRRHLPSVLILDLQMPKLNGFGVTTKLRSEFPAAQILLFTTYDGDEDIHRAMHAGARGYILKDARRAELIHAIRTVSSGARYLSPPVGAKLADAQTSPSLTEREREVLKLIAAGKANKEISFVMDVSESTVKTHVAALIAKLGATSRTEAALIAVRRGFLRG
jgi:two-component system NarL family response regulator